MSGHEELRYVVPGMSCGHCVRAVAAELERVPGVERVEVDLGTKLVIVRGIALQDPSLRAAIDEAGYAAER